MRSAFSRFWRGIWSGPDLTRSAGGYEVKIRSLRTGVLSRLKQEKASLTLRRIGFEPLWLPSLQTRLIY